jgi:hypothetical protein
VLEFFKRNHLFNSLLLLPYAFIIRGVLIILPMARIKGDIFGLWGSDVLTAIQEWGREEYILSTMLVFIHAVIINRLFIRHSMVGEINLFPGLAYILLTALHPSFVGMSSILVANTFLLIAMFYLFDVLKKDKQEETRFMAGWWLAVAGLLYTPYLFLVFFGIIAMSILKTLKIKDIFQYLTGFISPFLIGWMVRVITSGDLNPAFGRAFESFGLPVFMPIYGIPDVITVTIMGLLLLISILGYTQVIARKNIHAQKKIDTLYALVFFCIPMAFFPPTISAHYLMAFVIPFSLFLALMLRMARLPAVAESIHFILFVAAVLTQVLRLV